MDQIKKPLFFLAVILMLFVVMFEAGSVFFIGSTPENTSKILEVGISTSGYGITYLAVFDTLLIFTILIMTASMLIPEKIHGRLQGIITLIFSLIMIIISISLIFTTLLKLALMTGLLVSPVFGTIAYLAIFGNFETDSAHLVLGYIMILKFAFVILLVLSHHRFIENKGLMFILISSIAAGVIVSFCHGVVPGFLVSITDGIAGIIVLIITLIWSVIFFAGSVKSVAKASKLGITF